MPFIVFANCGTAFGANFHLANISGEHNFPSFFSSQIALALRTLLCMSGVSGTIELLVIERMVDDGAAELQLPFEINQKYSQELNDSMKRL